MLTLVDRCSGGPPAPPAADVHAEGNETRSDRLQEHFGENLAHQFNFCASLPDDLG